jgi:hypothetical protein
MCVAPRFRDSSCGASALNDKTSEFGLDLKPEEKTRCSLSPKPVRSAFVSQTPVDIERILAAGRRGEPGAVDDLFQLVYQELRLLAADRSSQSRPDMGLRGESVLRRMSPAYLYTHGVPQHQLLDDPIDG